MHINMPHMDPIGYGKFITRGLIPKRVPTIQNQKFKVKCAWVV